VRHPGDRLAYAAGKQPFIEAALARWAPDRTPGLETRGWNGTKSAFADCRPRVQRHGRTSHRQ